ncbi:MAG: class I SAM-dependent methyltransferase [Thermoguttaceae bacterium]
MKALDICSKGVVNVSAQSEANKAAWDRLYASTNDLVWGAEPLDFVSDSIRWLQNRNLLPENPRILDAATGEGRNLPFLIHTSNNVTACDASPAALGKLKTRFGEKVETVECDLAQMPFSSFNFDFVLACDIMETLPNLEAVLCEMARILRVGGVLVCNVPNFDDGIAGHEMEQLSSEEFLYQGNYFFRFQSEADFLAVLNQCGFEKLASNTSTWIEYAHPGYRDSEHSHTSRIIIATRTI